ncbi:uncharacterized protein LOC126978798 [Leptidea sinapis]|uniref:uncharacterized protein LOC126978798 n=1 Tax=Leptidea sinapis TaxID=189913 RepID=UPI002122579E|nr:uncharacterized protein LOC126978798 [Leptidea sinapis]
MMASIIMEKYCFDEETGEILRYRINEETGEPLLNNKQCSDHLVRESKISSIYGSKRPHKNIRFPKCYISKSKKFQKLKANILAGSNTTSHRMLLIFPTFMIFPSLICVILLLLEIYLHIQCHKKNKNLKDSNSYYRSPFHVVTSIFCGVCRDCDTASKIKKIQEKRLYKYNIK